MPAPTKNHAALTREFELRRKIPLSQAAELTSLSEDTLRRKYPSKILKLSDRRSAMALGDVLAIGEVS
jgi:hypothetical protein